MTWNKKGHCQLLSRYKCDSSHEIGKHSKLGQYMLNSPYPTTVKETESIALKIPTEEYQNPVGFGKNKNMKCYKELPPVLYDLFILKNLERDSL